MRLILFFALAGMALFTILPSQGADLVELARAARPAVMRLQVQDGIGRQLGTGTGFFLAKEGYIVTNHHVIDGADKVVADMSDGRKISILGLLAKDEANDIAILKTDFTPGAHEMLNLARKGAPPSRPGDRIFVIGAPIGLAGTLSEGIVSALRPSSDMDKFTGERTRSREDLLQISAAISPGSSGSPVINTSGEVIGVAVSYLGGGQNLNFAVPADVVHKLLAEITPDTKPAPFQNKSPLLNIIISVVFFVAVAFVFRHIWRKI
jgi:serine protease Do